MYQRLVNVWSFVKIMGYSLNNSRFKLRLNLKNSIQINDKLLNKL